MDKIVLPRIEIMACHGVDEWERSTPQPFVISVKMVLDLRPAADSDSIENTVHYGELYAGIKSLAENNSFSLIESLAQAVADFCLSDGRVQKVRVTVEKSQAQYVGLTFPAQVILERSR